MAGHPSPRPLAEYIATAQQWAGTLKGMVIILDGGSPTPADHASNNSLMETCAPVSYQTVAEAQAQRAVAGTGVGAMVCGIAEGSLGSLLTASYTENSKQVWAAHTQPPKNQIT